MTLFNFLIQQSKKPSGFVGRIMLDIMNNAHKNIYKLGLENVLINENCKLLDLGFGGGKVLKLLSKKYKNIELYGIDFSEVAIIQAIKNNKKDVKNGKIKLLQADIEKLPFSDNYFDIITAFQTHYHWEDLYKKVKEIYRVLNENRQFIIVAEKYKINYHMEKYKTEDELKQLLCDIGFIQIEYKETKSNICIKMRK
jgi:ubiquinone/menaquinone biosynthesis C-methylase UbiE